MDTDRLVRLMDGQMEDASQILVANALHPDTSIGATDQGRHLDMSTGATDQGRHLDMGATDQGRHLDMGAIDQGPHLDMSTGAIDQDHPADMKINVDEQYHLEAMRNQPFQGQRDESETLPLLRRRVPYSPEVGQTTSDGTYNPCPIDNSLGGGPQSNIYTTSRDEATGQALYHMVKDDPKLRDVSIIVMEGALQRDSRSEEFSNGFRVHIRPVYARISRRDPWKLLWDREGRARSGPNSYEIIEDDSPGEPDPSMGRDELAHRMNVEPQPGDLDPDILMARPTPAGLSSATEAQSNATAPATITSSNNQGGSKVAADTESTNLHMPEGSN
ncbi:unnamed protein product [Clonostachys byssicola]|uniref:Uncharacterized protein n=1 Tax=Clonostachys byssicola TaxID=160290 RepID=A0A9N9URI7_9HYPO|nr:unnamed protein product [Clonostachys byssicola]